VGRKEGRKVGKKEGKKGIKKEHLSLGLEIAERFFVGREVRVFVDPDVAWADQAPDETATLVQVSCELHTTKTNKHKS
jgi:hypothetical protein